jgi:hypothetical protein
MRRFVGIVVIAALALVVAQQAGAVGPWLWTVNGGRGVTAGGGDVRFVARLAGTATRVLALPRGDGARLRSISVPGHWGLQAATLDGEVTGLSGDGRLLVLTTPTRGEPAEQSSFLLVSTPSLGRVETIGLAGDFTVDALSPDGRTLYLVQHLVARGASRYQVRAYDVPARRLLPQVIADKRQAGWVMQGYPMARAETARGERVYTLYESDRNYPFVHALDTVHRTAFCIGLPIAWTDPAVLEGVRLRLDPGGRTLTVTGPNLERRITIDTATYRVATSAR